MARRMFGTQSGLLAVVISLGLSVAATAETGPAAPAEGAFDPGPERMARLLRQEGAALAAVAPQTLARLVAPPPAPGRLFAAAASTSPETVRPAAVVVPETDAPAATPSALVRPVPAPVLARAEPAPRRGLFGFGAAHSPAANVTDPVWLASQPVPRGDAQFQCLAQALYFEARGESPAGQAAVAEVILNRVESGRFPNSICGVVTQASPNGCQFSYMCDGKSDAVTDNRAWDRSARIARAMLDGAPRTLTGGATHFHTPRVAPDWSLVFTRTVAIGGHIFYRVPPRGRPVVVPVSASVAPVQVARASTAGTPGPRRPVTTME
jgi:spore germination cell wall hydrolase CwlJ-like protein